MNDEPRYWEDLPFWAQKKGVKVTEAMIARVMDNYAIGAYEGFRMSGLGENQSQLLAEEEAGEVEIQLRSSLEEKGLLA